MATKKGKKAGKLDDDDDDRTETQEDDDEERTETDDDGLRPSYPKANETGGTIRRSCLLCGPN